MSRSREQAKEDQRLARMGWATARAMALDSPVVLSGVGGTLLGEGKIVRRQRADGYGLLIFLEGSEEAIPLPFIQKMALSERS